MRQLIRSFQHAFHGLVVVFQTEQSFRIQSVIALAVLLLGWVLGVSQFEFVVLLLMVGLVLVLELVNSIFERIVDTFKPRIHPIVRDIKDIMAATVLIASFVAAAVGVIVFAPHLVVLVGRVS